MTAALPLSEGAGQQCGGVYEMGPRRDWPAPAVQDAGKACGSSLYSLFYVGYVTFWLLLAVLGLIANALYSLVFGWPRPITATSISKPRARGSDKRPIRVAMFTKNKLSTLI